MKKYRSIIILAVLILLFTAFIFSNSLKDISASTADSDRVIVIVKTLVGKVLDVEQIDWHFVVRKVAHWVEFCVLGILLGGLSVSMQKCFGRRYIAFPLLYCLLVAVADEYLQSFVVRTSSVTDIVLDFFGAVSGLLILAAGRGIIVGMRKRKSRHV